MKQPDITIFFNPSCPFCHRALDFIAGQLPDAVLEKIDLSTDDVGDDARFDAALKKCGSDSRGIPLMIVRGQCFQGFDEEIGREIKQIIDNR